MSAAYDDTNIFAKILRGEIPCYKVFEDEAALAFMDIMPRTQGHCTPTAAQLHLPGRAAKRFLTH